MDFYIILGVERAADVNDIKRAYKRLTRRFHPDINPGDRMAAAQFRQIAEADETLSDPDRRRRDDAAGGRPRRAPGGIRSRSRTVSKASISPSASAGPVSDVRRSVRRRDQPAR